MKNKTVVTIYDKEFTLVGEESEEYVRKIAALVDQRIREVTENARFSTLDAAILTAANIADDYFKALDAAEELRGQMRSYFEEISRLKDENDSLRRAARGSAGAGRRRRSLGELAGEPSAHPPVEAVTDAVAETEAALAAVAPEAPAAEEAPAEVTVPAAETAAEEPAAEEETARITPVTLVMDSEIAAAEEAAPVVPPEVLEEGEQLVFEK